MAHETDTPTGAVRLQTATLLRAAAERPGCVEWEVDVDGTPARAVAYPALVGPLAPGDGVLLNTTAVSLSLGTGGVHFVVARLDPTEAAQAFRPAEVTQAGKPAPPAGFPGREAGHVLKLRYTPLQARVCCAEEEASPHSAAVREFRSLNGTPVLAAELHSQGAAAAIAARAAAPDLRIAWLHLDSAALPAAFSRLLHRLRTDGIVDAVISVGQAFGGDLEAVNVYSGLAVARAVVRADLVIAAQGPGNAGTGTEYGFSGMAVLEALHAADALGGRPALVPRVSDADPRERHQGVSHHTHTLLRCARVPVTVPVTAGEDLELETTGRHTVSPVEADLEVLAPYAGLLTTMGRKIEEDQRFFRAACAAGKWAASSAELGVRSAE